MIKSEESRIGNYVLAEDDLGVWFPWMIGNYEELNPKIIKHRKPIPLDEEWLLRLGFERKTRISNSGASGIPVWMLYSFSLTIWDDGRLFYDWIGGNVEVQHVHHLQNIYSDLLRKQLTIKTDE